MVKKCLLIVAATFLVAGVVEATTLKNVTYKTKAEYQAKIDNAETPIYSKASNQLLIYLMDAPETLTVQEFIDLGLKAAKTVNFNETEAKNWIAGPLYYWFRNDSNTKQIYDYIMATDWNYSLKCIATRQLAKKLNISVKEQNAIYFENLKFCRADVCKAILETYFKTLPELDEATAKAQLKTLNRLFSPMLLKDKATWETYVAQVRTCLETY